MFKVKMRGTLLICSNVPIVVPIEMLFGNIETKALGTKREVIDGHIREDAHAHASLEL